MISKFLEYLSHLNTLSTRRARSILSTRSILKPRPIRERDGRMDTISMTAIGEKGYRIKDHTDLFSNLKSAVTHRSR